ncbi:FtsH protease activity modulator HflK [Halobacteriovorax sp. GB3]|uniref:FtsH protease activity modulator HflK n=1 Tax=Halobacteriovorax sp. GB3 TaxID=2719615 RepID=UPI00235F9987|nr:FtsH protease activity modulator HflK [Halobacteriovorax sp. GB3]MDD0854475.1 FtsH protease activity modulator HflK [Halobacteriovorax sp. GB3]
MTFSQSPKNEFEKMKEDIEKIKKFLIPVLILLVLGIGSMTTFYTVEPDEEAVVIRLGEFHNTNPPGLHFKVPFGIDRVIKVKTKRVLQAEFGFRTSTTRGRRSAYSEKSYKSESLMLTGDLNVADVEWAVQFQISDPFKFLFQTSEPERNIRDVSESIMRRVVGDRSVSEVLTTGKIEVETSAKDLMQEVLDHYDMGVKIVSVKLQDVNPPNVVKASFNEVNEAKQEQEKVINQAEGEYNKIIPEARGKAQKMISEAEGYKEELVNRSLGDAEKFVAILKEYKKAPSITKKRLYLETMESIYSRLENVTIVDPSIKGLLPVFDGKKGNK